MLILLLIVTAIIALGFTYAGRAETALQPATLVRSMRLPEERRR